MRFLSISAPWQRAARRFNAASLNPRARCFPLNQFHTFHLRFPSASRCWLIARWFGNSNEMSHTQHIFIRLNSPLQNEIVTHKMSHSLQTVKRRIEF